MFWKIAVSILWVGTTAVGLLMIRQQRIDAVHDQAVIHSRILHKRQMLWQLRIETQQLLTPERVSVLIQQYCDRNGATFKPLLVDPCLPVTNIWPRPRSVRVSPPKGADAEEIG